MGDDAQVSSHKFAWAFTGFFLLCAAVYASSTVMLGFLATAALVCPSERFRRWEPAAGLLRHVPGRLATFLAVAIFLLSCYFADAPIFSGVFTSDSDEVQEQAAAQEQTEDQGQSQTDEQAAAEAEPTRSMLPLPKAGAEGDALEDVRLVRTTKVVEYGRGAIDATRLVSCSDATVTVTAEDLSIESCGKQTVTYTLERNDATRTVTKTFTVRDTKGPQIVLADAAPSIDRGEAFDPYACVTSVEDPVDGPLAQVDVAPAEDGDGWYTIEGTVDADVAGTYFLTVRAHDRNANQATKELRVSVVDDAATADAARDYVINVNSGKFHYPSCSDVALMRPQNRRDVHMTRTEVLEQGYAPCRHCNP